MACTRPRFALIEETPLPPHVQMALDEVLLERLLSGERGPTARFWGWTEPALVIGSNQSVANEVDLEAAERHGFTVTRRISGGGTMVAQPGRTVTWSLYVPASAVEGMSFAESYGCLDAFAIERLRRLGVDAWHRPLNDIAAPDGGKIAGAAQARRRHGVLHHTTLAWSLENELVRELIRIGRPPLSERGVRSAEKPVSPLAALLPGLDREQFVAELIDELQGQPSALTDGEVDEAWTLAAAKYSRPEWIHRLG